MCEDPMCLLKLNRTRGRENGGMDIYILKLTSGYALKSGENIMIMPLDTFWNGIVGLAKSGALPLMSNWRNGNVSGLALTWPHLRNCTQLILDSDSMIRLQGRKNETAKSVCNETYYVCEVSAFAECPDWLVSLERESVSELKTPWAW